MGRFPIKIVYVPSKVKKFILQMPLPVNPQCHPRVPDAEGRPATLLPAQTGQAGGYRRRLGVKASVGVLAVAARAKVAAEPLKTPISGEIFAGGAAKQRRNGFHSLTLMQRTENANPLVLFMSQTSVELMLMYR